VIPPFKEGLFLAAIVLLSACAAPVNMREAQTIARERVVRYCSGRCGAITLARTQKIKDRWLVDLDDPRHKFTVIVENDGNARVSVWNKQ
jgi:hypothetical protein